jgi:hypothetical protein
MKNAMAYAAVAGTPVSIATTGHGRAVAGVFATPAWRTRSLEVARTFAPADAAPTGKRTAVAVFAAWTPPL